MTIRGNWGLDFVEQSLFKKEHLERLIEQMKEPITLKDIPIVDWDTIQSCYLTIDEDKPESIENE